MSAFKAWLIAFVGMQALLMVACYIAGAFGVFAGWPWWSQVVLGIAISLISVGFSLWVERRVDRYWARREASDGR